MKYRKKQLFNNVLLIIYVKILFNFSRLWFIEIVLHVWFNCMKITAKETQNEWLVSSPEGNKILVNMEIVSNIYYVCIKFMFLSKNHEDIWKWIVFILFIIIYQIFKKNKNSQLSINHFWDKHFPKDSVTKIYLLSSCRFIRDKKYRIWPYTEILSLIHSKTIHIISSQIIPKYLTLIQITN